MSPAETICITYALPLWAAVLGWNLAEWSERRRSAAILRAAERELAEARAFREAMHDHPRECVFSFIDGLIGPASAVLKLDRVMYQKYLATYRSAFGGSEPHTFCGVRIEMEAD